MVRATTPAVDTNVSVELDNQTVTFQDVKRLIAPGLTDQEAILFLKIAEAVGLNPFKREIYAIKYGQSPAQFVTGYQVYLQRAEMSGKLNGWSVEVDDEENPTKATVTIHRKDWDLPFVWTAYAKHWNTGRALWKDKPGFMLRKVAIGQAFRLAFPVEVAGLPYLEEEATSGATEIESPPLATIEPPKPAEAVAMIPEENDTEETSEPDVEDVEIETEKPKPRVTNARVEDPKLDEARRFYFRSIKGIFKDDDERHEWQKNAVGKESVRDWTLQDFGTAAEKLGEMMAERAEAEEDTKPKPATKAQLSAIARLCQQRGFRSVGDTKFLDKVEETIGRRPDSITKISADEAGKIIEALQPPIQEGLL